MHEQKGYIIADYDSTGMLEIQKDDSMNMFSYDKEAVEQAMKDGVKIIPVEEVQCSEKIYAGMAE